MFPIKDADKNLSKYSAINVTGNFWLELYRPGVYKLKPGIKYIITGIGNGVVELPYDM